MPLFGLNKKKSEMDSPPTDFSETQNDAPVEQVLALRQQGMSNNQIIQNLQQQGYSTNLVYDALSHADVKETAEPAGYGQYPENSETASQIEPEQGYYSQPSFTQNYAGTGSQEERIEEIAEAIIEEKWNELIKNVNKITEWKEKTETRITQLEQKMADLRQDFETLHTGVLGKVGEYDQNLTNLGAEIKAMEKVFSKILPTFTENVNELSRLAKDLKMRTGK